MCIYYYLVYFETAVLKFSLCFYQNHLILIYNYVILFLSLLFADLHQKTFKIKNDIQINQIESESI